MKALLLYLLPVCYVLQPATIETPVTPDPVYSLTVKKSFFRLGTKLITLNKFVSARERPFLFINLHNDEAGLIEKAKDLIGTRGGELIVLENEGQQMIESEVWGKTIVFDPSRIFTFYGRKFKPKKGINYKIDQHVRQLAEFITNEVDDGKHVVDIHSHTQQDKTMSYYKQEVRKFRDVKEVYQNPVMDETDYFITSDENLFQQLRSMGFNTVLQSSTKLKELGMLDDFCQKMKSKYLLVVTRTEHQEMQERMLNALYEIF